MITVDTLRVRTGVRAMYEAARAVERWPEWLPHYRWVEIHRRETGGGSALVEMAAWRPFGPLRWPTWWMSEMICEDDAPRIRYRHVRGITRGMDVTWEFAPSADGVQVTITHTWKGPPWPVIGPVAAAAVIGPVFIHGIASRTLAGIGAHAERTAQ